MSECDVGVKKRINPIETRHTYFMLLNTDRMDAELDELSDSEESTELPKLDLTGPVPFGIRNDGDVRSFCCVASDCC